MINTSRDRSPSVASNDERVGGETAANPFVRRVYNGSSNTDTGQSGRAPIRVAYCLASMAESGGIESNAVRTAEAIDTTRVRFTAFAMRAEGAMRARYEATGVQVVAIPAVNTLVSAHTARQVLRFARMLRVHGTDVVHCHDPYTNWVAGLAARIAGLPLLTSKRWVNASRRHLLLSRLSYKISGRVLANSVGVAQTLVDFDGVPPARVVVVPNFVEDAAFEVPSARDVAQRLAKWGVGVRRPVIGCVARLRPEKGQAVLLRAVARLTQQWPDLALVLVGDGPEEQSLRTLASELGIADSVYFAGHQPNRPNLHALFDVSVLVSDHEGFPNTVIEAMAAGRPVVATNVGGVPDAVSHEETGLLVPPRDPVAVAGAIARLLDAPEWSIALGARGREVAHTRFAQTPILERLVTVYRELARISPPAAQGISP